MNASISAFAESARDGSISVVEHTHKILEEAEKSNPKYAHFNIIAKESALEEARRIEKEIKKRQCKRKASRCSCFCKRLPLRKGH